MRHWILAVSAALTLLPCDTQAQVVSRDQDDSFTFFVRGGERVVAEQMVLAECKKLSKYFNRAALISEQKQLLLPAYRFYRCSLLEDPAELERPGSLQQRLMQTRRFKKTASEVALAIGQWAEDNGWQGGNYLKFAPRINSLTQADVSLRIGTRADMRMIKLRVEISDRQGEADVRIRTFSVTTEGETEFFTPKIYRSIFDDFAQQLFIEAIEIAPSEMQ